MRVKDAVGRFGEDVAADRLHGEGWEILARNWRPPRGGTGIRGELDIVARDGTTLVFVEVKTRSGTAFGSPAEAVGHDKVARIRRLAVLWLQAHAGELSAAQRSSVRFDVVSIVRGSRGLTVDHLRGAF